jgi:hypothetical protein
MVAPGLFIIALYLHSIAAIIFATFRLKRLNRESVRLLLSSAWTFVFSLIVALYLLPAVTPSYQGPQAVVGGLSVSSTVIEPQSSVTTTSSLVKPTELRNKQALASITVARRSRETEQSQTKEYLSRGSGRRPL